MLISSLQNPHVKQVCQLHQKKFRVESGLILIEGRHPLEEALNANLEIQSVYLQEGEIWSHALPVEPAVVTEAVMSKLSTTNSPAPVLAVAKQPAFTSANYLGGETGTFLGLVMVQDPGNLGTLIRSACAFGIKAIALIGPHVDPYSPKVVRASAGLLFRLPLIIFDEFDQLKAQLQQVDNLTILGADAHQGMSYREVKYARNTFVLLGGEAHGLPQDVWEFALPVNIPMQAAAESLNVAVAGAIILSEIYQQHL